MSNELIVELKLELDDIKSELNQIKKDVGKAGTQAGDKFEKNFKKSTNGLATQFRTLGKLAVAAFAAGAVLRGINAVVSAAQVQEDAINRLNVALKTSGEFSLEASQDFQEYASSLQDVTRFGDEVILNQLALAKSFGASNEQAKEIVTAATDLAEAFKIDLESATRNVAKTLGGFAGELGEVIPELKNLTQAQLQAGEGVDVLAAKFKGTAGQSVQTFSGATDQLGNAFGDLLESIGQVITNNPAFVSIIQGTTEIVKDLGAAAGLASGAITKAFGAKEENTRLQRIDEEIAQVINRSEKLKKALSFDVNQGTTQGLTFEKELRTLEKLEKGLLRRRKLIVDANRKNGKKEVEDNKAKNEQIRIENEKLAARLGSIGLTRLQTLQAQQSERLAILRAALSTQEIDQEEFNARALETKRVFEEQRKMIDDEAAMNAEANLENIGAAWVALGRKTKNTAGQIASILNDVLARGIGNTFQKVGQALANNENAMQAFADGVKGIFADLASSLGDYYIKVGIAEVAKTKGAFGWDTIAAGSGLKILSGVLGSGGGGGGSAGSSSGSGGTGPAEAGTTALDQEPEVATPGESTVLNLNIQGSLIQQEELGQFISDTLSESGAKNDTVVTNFRSVG